MLDQLISQINDSQRTLWILCGLPYSGKTHLAQQISAMTPIVHISIDRILEDSGFDWNTDHLPDKAGWEKIFNLSYTMTRDALKGGLSVLYDSTNHTKASRDMLRDIAQELGTDAKVIFVDAPVGVVWERWTKNSLTKNRSVIARDLVEQTIKSFETPSGNENVVHYKVTTG